MTKRINQRLKIQNEVLHGKYLLKHDAEDTWNWSSPAGRVRWQRRLAMLQESIEDGMNVLEIGCGTGLLTKELAQKKISLTSIDISPDLLKVVRNKFNFTNVTFLLEDAAQMSFKNITFDVVLGSSVLHHLDVEKAIREIFRVLKPGGIVAFTEPNMMNPQIALVKSIPFLKRMAGDSPDETAFFRWGIKKQFERNNFMEVQASPFDFLHPAIPKGFIKTINQILNGFEKIPLLKEIAGSLFIKARKDGAKI